MSFRLAFSRLQLSIGYPSQSLVKGLRTYCDSKKFKSLLPDRNTASPFYDLTRTADNRSEKYVIRSGDSTLAEGSSSEVYARNSTMNDKVSEQQEAVGEVLNRTLIDNEDHSKTGEFLKNSEDLDVSEDVEKMKRRKRMERNTRIGGIIVVGGTLAGLVAFCLYYGRAKRDESGNIILDEWSGTFFAPFYRISNSFKLWRDYVIEPAREQLLPDPLPAPYLQPKYTLVIEMKNILIHPEWTYKTGYRFAKRPALDYFLDVVGYPNFEVVIYTSESMMTAHPVVESFDLKQRIMYKLYRDCTKYMNGHHVKDLSKLNRDLSKVIFIEFDPKSAQLNPENMLCVPEWKGNMDDTSLVDLAELLKTIHLSDTEDVRPMLQYYSQFDDPAKEFRRRAIYLAEQEEQKKFKLDHDDQSLLKRYSGRLFGFRRHAST